MRPLKRVQQVIKDKVYDTQSSLFLFRESCDGLHWDYYRSRKDQYFKCGLCGVCLITEREVKKTLAVAQNVELYIKLFGTPEEG